MKRHLCGPNPVFIGCMPRSGSSLLRMMLDSHPKLFADAELSWVGSPNPQGLLSGSHKLAGGKRYVGKEPKIISRGGIRLLKKLFGGTASLIHITREPEDVYWSYRKSKVEDWQFIRDAERFIGGLSVQRQWPRCLRVRYEKLVLDTETELRKICTFLRIPFSERMLNHHKYQHRKLTGIYDSVHYSDRMASKPVFKTSIGQPKTLGPVAVKLCEKMRKAIDGYTRIAG